MLCKATKIGFYGGRLAPVDGEFSLQEGDSMPSWAESIEPVKAVEIPPELTLDESLPDDETGEQKPSKAKKTKSDKTDE